MADDQLIKTISDYLLELNMPFESIGEGMWVVHDDIENIDNIVVSLEEPLVIFRVKLMTVPSSNKEKFYEKLLQLNVLSLIHGAYALEDNHVVIVDTLEAENLDLNEFQASIDSIIMAITSDYKELSQFITK